MAQETDHFYTQSYRYGPKNQRLRAYNRDRAMSGMNGYPSDKKYMKAVADAGYERDQEKMSVEGDKAAAKYKKSGAKKKVAAQEKSSSAPKKSSAKKSVSKKAIRK